MGAAWCRERAVKAQDSKSPFDRVIVKCVNQMSLSENQGVQSSNQNPPSRPTKSAVNHHVETDSGWQNVVLRVPDEAPVPPPRKKRQITQTQKTPSPPPPPRTPSIHLEIDTPESIHKIKTPLEMQNSSFARQKSDASLEVRGSAMSRQKSDSSLEVRGSAMSRQKSDSSLEVLNSAMSRQKSNSSLEVNSNSFSRQKSNSSLEVSTTLSRQKSRSFNCLPLEIDLESKNDEPDVLRPPRSVSSMSNRSIGALSDATSERLDNYLKNCRSFGSLKPEELISDLNQALQQSDGSSDSDEWAGIDDWDLGFRNCHVTSGTPPLTPTSQLMYRKGPPRAQFTVGDIPEPRRKVKTKKPSDAASKNNATPSKFQNSPKSSVAAKTLIKPEQIPVRDFLRQSEKSTLHEKRRGANLTVDVSPRNLSPSNSFSFDFSSGGLAPPRSPQITLPGTPCTPRSLSRCNSPLPPQCREACVTPPSSPTEDTASSLLRLLNEYHAAAELIGEVDARKILDSLKTSDELNDESEHHETSNNIADAEVKALVDEHHAAESLSSGRSSTNQSLAELETALSEFLEASQNNREDGDDEEHDVTDKSAFAPIKQEPPTVTPRAKKSVMEANPEITITTATEDKPEDEGKQDSGVEVQKSESSFVPIRRASNELKKAEKQSVEKQSEEKQSEEKQSEEKQCVEKQSAVKQSAEKKGQTPETVKFNDAPETNTSLFEPIKEVQPVIMITIVAEDGGKKAGGVEVTSKTSVHSKPAFQVNIDE